MLKDSDAKYKEYTHAAQGHGAEVAKIHGAELKQGAKAIVLKVKPAGYYLAVFPADQKLDAKQAKQVLNVKNVSFASLEETRALTECEIGSVPPFSFNEKLPLIVDPSLFANKTIFFNIGRLESSITLDVGDYKKLISNAKIATIVASGLSATLQSLKLSDSKSSCEVKLATFEKQDELESELPKCKHGL